MGGSHWVSGPSVGVSWNSSPTVGVGRPRGVCPSRSSRPGGYDTLARWRAGAPCRVVAPAAPTRPIPYLGAPPPDPPIGLNGLVLKRRTG
ncbi:hypothetical protein FE633_39570 [Streptomyces montanus]|uniref:Uncharacterized protein n=1 Tax=Streptomyces montanus TaxID=2580423 RepID=A0A5R9FIV6_9ACTN|nr:hypothetical protein FE633_39570 [Streptomyces montanus]